MNGDVRLGLFTRLVVALAQQFEAAIRTAISELEQATQAMAQHLHSKGDQGGGSASTSPGGGGPGDGKGDGKGGDDVIDAEFEVK